MHQTVPIIDIAPFLKGSPDEQQQVVAEVEQACREIGFMTIVGHGIPQTVINKTYQTAKRFFDRPLEEKMAVQRTESSYGWGYVPMQAESLAASIGQITPGDLKETMSIGPVHADNAKLWPANPPELMEAWSNYYQALEQLGQTLMHIFATALDLKEDYFDDKFVGHNSFLRVLNYPELEEAPLPDQLRAGPHTDYGCLTILRSENVPGGLQVRNRAGEWVDVKVTPECFIVNIGDMLMHWTNDRWISTLHQVIPPPHDAKGGTRRISMAYFYHPNDNAMITCIESCWGPDNPPKYEPVTAGEHRKRKSRKSLGADEKKDKM